MITIRTIIKILKRTSTRIHRIKRMAKTQIKAIITMHSGRNQALPIVHQNIY